MIAAIPFLLVAGIMGLVWAGLALFALLDPVWGTAGAMATVAGTYFLLCLIVYLVTWYRGRIRQRQAALAKKSGLDQVLALVPGLAQTTHSLAKDHPWGTVAVCGLIGFLAGSHPKEAGLLARQLADLVSADGRPKS